MKTNQEIIKEAEALITKGEEYVRKYNEHIDKVFMEVHGCTYAEFNRRIYEYILLLVNNQHNRTV